MTNTVLNNQAPILKSLLLRKIIEKICFNISFYQFHWSSTLGDFLYVINKNE
jgi:hypothetical protein